ncbi:hypothetical protein ACF08W_31445 [Streptomyces sp. NPDC015144]|uniref:hypothetical protein n=1 Tax=Streptomyces sp. NPDC015144 TaxID=3364944 RepID=UPI0036FF9352
MKQLKRSAVAVLSALALGGAALAVTAAPAQAAQDSAAVPSAAQGVYWLYFDYTSWSHKTPDALASTHVGYLNEGSNYVKCWDYGQSISDKGRTSSTWFKTDDDSGNANVWVSKVYVRPSDWNIYVPRCP